MIGFIEIFIVLLVANVCASGPISTSTDQDCTNSKMVCIQNKVCEELLNIIPGSNCLFIVNENDPLNEDAKTKEKDKDKDESADSSLAMNPLDGYVSSLSSDSKIKQNIEEALQDPITENQFRKQSFTFSQCGPTECSFPDVSLESDSDSRYENVQQSPMVAVSLGAALPLDSGGNLTCFTKTEVEDQIKFEIKEKTTNLTQLNGHSIVPFEAGIAFI